MITTINSKPVIKQECDVCYGSGYRMATTISPEANCTACNGKGHIITEIPDSYLEEVKELMKVKKIIRGEYLESEFRATKAKYNKAQNRLLEIEREILKG